MTINKKQIAFNRTARTQKAAYIVIHDTGNTGKGSDAEAHFKYFNGGDRQASYDFVVDDKQVLQVNDYTKFYSWHCGDGKGAYGITNGNSVGVSICINSDGDYNKAFSKLAELTRYLMKELGIPADRVVRHYDASRKSCPNTMAGSGWAKWQEFKKAVTAAEPAPAAPKEITTVNDIVWELAHRGIISDKELWLKKLTEDTNAYWLARKTVAFLQGKGV